MRGVMFRRTGLAGVLPLVKQIFIERQTLRIGGKNRPVSGDELRELPPKECSDTQLFDSDFERRNKTHESASMLGIAERPPSLSGAFSANGRFGQMSGFKG